MVLVVYELFGPTDRPGESQVRLTILPGPVKADTLVETAGADPLVN